MMKMWMVLAGMLLGVAIFYKYQSAPVETSAAELPLIAAASEVKLAVATAPEVIPLASPKLMRAIRPVQNADVLSPNRDARLALAVLQRELEAVWHDEDLLQKASLVHLGYVQTVSSQNNHYLDAALRSVQQLKTAAIQKYNDLKLNPNYEQSVQADLETEALASIQKLQFDEQAVGRAQAEFYARSLNDLDSFRVDASVAAAEGLDRESVIQSQMNVLKLEIQESGDR